ncbi:MAG: transcription termination/antitermination protein NusA [Gammaproteobacteria bacterium]|nr:transcription termination/antitermination protein NusA [Gammaproteobacteria bacterium]MYF53465.1 transcription termination/antitermination protein NusA [Gammaproteobacteria bacterium]MYK42668.1 transcription termination/antitermination protein NusA [Gammaproteobacteria bacterium]
MNFTDMKNAVESVSNEKRVPKEAVFAAIESALATATKRRVREDAKFRVSIDWDESKCETFRVWTVVDPELMGENQSEEDAEDLTSELDWKNQEFNPDAHLTLDQAQEKQPSLKLGDEWEEPWPSINQGRIMAQIVKQVIAQKLREAERNRVAEEYRDSVGKLVSGTVKRQGRENLILELGGSVEGIIHKDNLIQRQHHRVNDRVQAYLLKIESENKGPLLTLSRTCKEMLVELFKKEVPEIAEDVIEIRAVARIPGQRAKIAVTTNDGRIDAVGACVGMRGSRVQAVSSELENERIDVLQWSADPAQLVANAMSPAVIEQIIKDEDLHSMDVLVRPEHHATAIGSNGENVRLASELTGWKLNIRSYDEVIKEQEERENLLMQTFMERLQVDEDLAQVLLEENFNSLEEIAYCEIEEMLSIEGFNEELVAVLRDRATAAVEEDAASGVVDESQARAPSVDLINLEGMTDSLAWRLAAEGVRTVEDLADQAIPDILDMEIGVSAELAGKLIMTARSPMFADSKK